MNPDAGQAALPGDHIQYVRLVQYFRGEPAPLPVFPHCRRVLGPLLAAPLPLAPQSALNVVNLLALVGATLLAPALARRVGAAAPFQLVAGLLFAVSFPVFYYGAIGYVDPIAVAAVVAVTWALWSGRWAWAAVLLGMGALARETVVIGLVPAAIVLVLQLPKGAALARFSLCLALFSAGLLLARAIAPDGIDASTSASWETWRTNVSRPRAWIGTVLSLGVPGALAIGGLLRAGRWPADKTPVLSSAAGGMLAAFLLVGYAFAAAHADGRFAWMAAPFSIPLGVWWLPTTRWGAGRPSVAAPSKSRSME